MKTALARVNCPRAIVGLLGTILLAGCAASARVSPTLPEHHPFVPEQFVLHGNLPMRAQEQLVSDLTAHRVGLSRDLALPTSDATIHVYLFDNADQFDEYRRRHHPHAPPGRAFFARRKTPLEIYAMASHRLSEDLRHEVTHAYLQTVLAAQPLWLDEGLAEYYERPRERDGLNQPHVDLLLDALAKGAWRPDLARLESLGAGAAMTQLDYAESWAWVHWLLRTDPSRVKLLREHLAELHGTGQAEPLSARLRVYAADPSEELVAHLRRLAASGR